MKSGVHVVVQALSVVSPDWSRPGASLVTAEEWVVL